LGQLKGEYHGQPHQPNHRTAGADQASYHVGRHAGHPLIFGRGRQDAGTWADAISVGMAHGSFDMAGLAEYVWGLSPEEYIARCDPWPLNPRGELNTQG